MTDVFTKAKRSEVMSRIRGKGNEGTEMSLIRLFKIHGIREWRRDAVFKIKYQDRNISIRPDFVFRKLKIAIFVDGEFWHGHPTRSNVPKTNRAFWVEKIQGNIKRDRLQNRLLRKHGWIVVRIWAFELKTQTALRKLGKAGLF